MKASSDNVGRSIHRMGRFFSVGVLVNEEPAVKCEADRVIRVVEGQTRAMEV
ncbi:hypothetical protein FLK61_39220 [Paenalkalicoccus suaedae]|uniref:Uncharacterized protein n=1 Tax=Paenalkalicoccus suaedae TaxID=2592382 RepID=A0A859FIG3_9BACI|nr:hypothetical protein FLK61_39220 [Paenalkalicoccus suaedae]